MTLLLAGLAVLCIVYYAVIVIYSGFTTSFSFIWLFMAGMLFLLAGGHEFYIRNVKKIPFWIPVSTVTVCVTGCVVFGVVELLIFGNAASGDTKNLDYLIVLGARLNGDQVNNSLKKRLDKSMEYIEQNPDTILVLSGGREGEELITEAQAMFDYLSFNGVEKEQMILETYSTSTVENIAYSRIRIEEDLEARRRVPPLGLESKTGFQAGTDLTRPSADPTKPPRIGVLTSDFHVFRARQIAKKWGIPDIYGIGCDTDPVLFVHFCVRECAAILKDKLMGNM